MLHVQLAIHRNHPQRRLLQELVDEVELALQPVLDDLEFADQVLITVMEGVILLPQKWLRLIRVVS